MNGLIALIMASALSGEPALAGGPDASPVRGEAGAERAHGAATLHHRFAHIQTPAGGDRVHRGARTPVRAGDPVQLSGGFFATSLSGGVEQPAPRIVYVRRGGIGVVRQSPASPSSAPVSAGRAAAARGLPRP